MFVLISLYCYLLAFPDDAFDDAAYDVDAFNNTFDWTPSSYSFLYITQLPVLGDHLLLPALSIIRFATLLSVC